MSNFPQKRKVNVAAVSKRKHDMSHYHVGTTDFGIMKPIECRYLVPGDEVNINVLNETRVLNAMPSPTIGKFDVVYRSFFVPLHVVWSPFYDFIKNQQHVFSGVLVDVPNTPYVFLGDIVLYLVDPDNGMTEEVFNPTTRSEYDFSRVFDVQSVNQTRYFKFTKKGRNLFSFLNSLGINIPLGGLQLNTHTNDIKLHIVLPLLCFWKFYFDWIVPSRFIHDHEDYIQLLIAELSESYDSTLNLNADTFFKFLCHEPLAYYEDDFFTTLTKFPFQDSNGLQDSIYILNPSRGGSDVSVDQEPSDNINGSFASSVDDFNMYTLQTLGKLQDYLNRGLIAGTKVQDWLLTEFGIRPNNDALQLSTYLGSKRTTLSVSDVISNADTEAQGGTPLGAYGGYVRNNQQFDFHYQSDEHGFYFITYEIVPKTNYYQGLAAQFDMKDRFDFFQSEFDNQQGMPVPQRRLYFSQNTADEQLTYQDVAFGFGLQYSDMKYAQDVISGDFRTRFGLQLKPWFLARDVAYIQDPATFSSTINEEFCLVKSEYQDWHYIFSDTSNELDPFLVAFHFKELMVRPMKSVVEGFEPTYQQSGKDVSLDFSGSVK